MRKARAINLALESMGPQEGIVRQIWKVLIGRTYAAARLFLPEKCARYEADIIFAHQDGLSSMAWKIQLQDEQALLSLLLLPASSIHPLTLPPLPRPLLLSLPMLLLLLLLLRCVARRASLLY